MSLRYWPCGTFLCVIFFFFGHSTASCQVVAGISANGQVIGTGDTVNVCQGNSISFLSVAQGSLLISWRFQNGSATTGSGIGPFPITYNVSGFDTVFQKITDGNYADSTYLIVQVTNQKPTADFSWSPNGQCGNIPVQFTNLSTGNTLTYNWTFGDGGTSTQNSPSYSFLNAIGSSGTSNYIVNLNVTNPYGCSATVNHTVNVENTPDASIGNADPNVLFGTFSGVATFKNCNNIPSYTFSFLNQSTTTSINTGYTIHWGDGTPDSSFTSWPAGVVVKHTFPLGSSSMTVTVPGSNGCTGIRQYDVFLGSTPAGGLASLGNTDICASDSLRFALSNVSGNPPGTQYSFLINDGSPPVVFQQPPPTEIGHFFAYGSCGFISSSGNSSFNNAFGAYLTIENPCGTTSPSVVPIYVSGKPRASAYVSPSRTVCVNSPVEIQSTSTYGSVITANGGTSSTCTNNGVQVWAISPSTGYMITSGSTGSLNGNPGNGLLWTNGTTYLDVIFTTAGTYVVKIYVSNNHCGMDSSSETICVRNAPQASFTMPGKSQCGPGALPLTNTSPIGVCGGDGYNWAITYIDPLGCGTVVDSPYTFTGGTSAASYSPSVQLNTAGKYIIQLTVTALNAGIACAPAVYQDTFTVIGAPKVTIQPINAICPGNTVSPVAKIDSCYSPGPFTYQWQFTSGMPATVATPSAGAIGFPGVGRYPYTFTVTDANCTTTTTDTGSIVVIPPPVAAAGNDTTVCSGAVFGLGVPGTPGVIYSWTPSTGLNDSIIANPVLTAAYTGTGSDTTIQYIVVATLSSLCTSTDTINVTIRRKPMLQFSPSNSQVCIGDTLQLTATGATSYNWSPAPLSTSLAGDTAYVNPAVTTVYSLTGQFSWGCPDTMAVTVTVRPNASAIFTTTATSLCSGGGLSNLITVTPNPAADSLYIWRDNGVLIGSNTTGAFPGLSNNIPGEMDTIKLLALSPYGCLADSMQQTFITIPQAVAHFTGNAAAGCGPLNIYFSNQTSGSVPAGGPAATQYFWDFGNGQTSLIAQPATISFLPSPYNRDTAYIITLKTYNGCDTTLWKDTVTVYANPRAAFLVSQVLGCSPFTDTLTNVSAGNTTSYAWDLGDGTTFNTTSLSPFTHLYHTGVIDTLTLTLTAYNRCGSNTDSLDIVVSPASIRPGILLNGNTLFGCAPFTANFVNNSTGAAQITVNFADGSAPVTVPGNQSVISHQYIKAGTYSVTMQLSNACTDTSISGLVTVYAPPVPAFTLSPDPICTGKAITVTNLSANANSYTWDWGDSTSSQGPGGQHTYSKGGNYEVQLTAGFVNNYGTVCQVGGDSMSVQVVDLIPAVIDTGLAKACTPFNLLVTAANATGAGSVTWTFFDNSRPGGSFMATGQMASYQYNQPGAYQVQLVVQNVAGCADTALHSFTVSATPQLTATPFGPLYTCNTDTLVSLAASISYAGQDSLAYSWTINGQQAGAGNPLDYRFELPADSIEPVSYLIQTTATNSAGCADTINAGTLVIRPLPPPDVLISPDSIIYQPDYTFTFRDSISRPTGMRYTWDFGDQNGEGSGPETVHQYGDTGTYTVRVELADEVTGCRKEDTTQVRILYVPGYLYVPDAICPGCSVAQLRTFLPKGHGLSEYHLRIYNAWGQLLFETTALDSDGAPSEPWNAQYNGRPIQEDAYRWQIEARYINGTEWKGMVYPNHRTPVKSGFITVIR